jgi:hypothetical protein
MKVQVTQIQVKDPVRIDAGNIAEMAENIREFGLLHPVVVRQIHEGNYELVAGYRRLKACEQLGWTEIPITIINAEDALRKLDTLLHENLRRKEFNYIEMAEAIFDRRKYWEQAHGAIQVGRPSKENSDQEIVYSVDNFIDDTSKICKLERAMIYKLLQLNDLDEDLKEQVRERTLPYRKALTIQRERKQSGNPAVVNIQGRKMKHPSGVPNQNECEAFYQKFQNAPNLAQLIFLVQHIWKITGDFKEREIEWESLDLEYSYQLMQWCAETMNYFQGILEEVGKVQEKLVMK